MLQLALTVMPESRIIDSKQHLMDFILLTLNLKMRRAILFKKKSCSLLETKTTKRKKITS